MACTSLGASAEAAKDLLDAPAAALPALLSLLLNLLAADWHRGAQQAVQAILRRLPDALGTATSLSQQASPPAGCWALTALQLKQISL